MGIIVFAVAYYTAEITLHRAILRSHRMPDSSMDLILITRQAAKMRFVSVLDFVKRLKQEHSRGFWYFSSSISLAILGIFARVLTITSLDEEERKSYIALLAEYRWILRISSTGAGLLKYGVAVLDANGQLLEQMQSPISPAENETLLSPDIGISPEDGNWKGDTFYLQSLDYASNGSNDRSIYDLDFFGFDISGVS
ncbi:hypothetical protein BT63DRAFT_111855 [Microthyrium microscopicum]|uniref:Uncharacterized protein n=1 Tax=Microthyrium microscopicum TaxID=703497 RepID=A0A6A6TWB4_9PEZI|nr:hypothetical protein BT63DRAFT_111855 [Microthyrium microscopicum]